jgi:hypothetical protein
LQNVSGFINFIVVFFGFDDKQNASGVLDLKEDLLGTYISDSFDEFGAVRFCSGRKPGHCKLDHFDLGLLALSSSVHEEIDLLVELFPSFSIVEESDLL